MSKPDEKRMDRIPLEKRRGGGRPKPRTPSGEIRQWEPPTEGKTPADRKKPKADRET